MQSRNENSTNRVNGDICYDQDCRFHGREHKHVKTNDGEYVKYIIQRSPQLIAKEINDADTWR